MLYSHLHILLLDHHLLDHRNSNPKIVRNYKSQQRIHRLRPLSLGEFGNDRQTHQMTENKI